LALACGLAMSPTPAPAQSTWTNISSGMWTNATRWSNGVPNGVGTIAVFAGGNSGAASVTNNISITNSAIIFVPTAGNSYTISSNSSGGILYLQGNGGSALIQAGSASINNSANQILNIPLVMLSNLIVSNLLTSGTLTVNGSITNSGFNLTLEDTGPTTLAGPISGSGGLTKKGTGVLTLSSSAGNTYSGGTLISAGTLQVNTVGGIQGGVTNNSSVVYYGSGSGTYGGVMSGSGSLVISNNSGMSLFLTNQNTFTGSILVEQGNLGFSNASGSANTASGISILSGTSLILDNRSVSNFNRIANVPLSMQGATLLVLGGGTNNIGTITFGTGGSVISNVVSLISTPTLSRGTGFATVNFTGGGTNLFATQSGASNAILPWAFIKGADFATHDGDGTALRAFTNYSSTFAADTNVKATTVNSVGGMTINSLVLGTNLTVTTDQTLTNTSGGMILTLANQFITNGSLRFSAEAIVENENAATVYTTLVTPSGLTKTGAGTLTLLGTNQNAGGILRVNQGSFTVGEGGVVNGGDALVNAGTFNMNGGTATLNSLVVTNATPGTTANLTLGYGTLTTTNGVILNNNASLLVGGVSGKTMVWNMLGGTNVTGTAGGSLSVSVGGLNFVANTGLVVVAGPTTVWSNNMTLWLGGNLSSTGHINSVGQMAISNGAVVYVTGSSSTISGLAVGSQGGGSSLLLADGGKLYYTGANAFSVGPNTSSSNNTILVTGSGSVLNTTTNRGINIGTKSSGGGGNQITVASSSTVLTAGLAMGGAFNSSGAGTGSDGGVGSNNTVLVYGSGTLWSNANGASAVFVGFSGAGNRLIVSNNAVFASLGNLTVANTGGTSNQLLVLDGGQVKAPTIVIGNSSGSFNSMVIASRGTVVSTSGTSTLGNGTGGNSNSVLVTGSGSIWNNAGNLTVGFASDIVGNQLTISSSGQVINATGKIGGSARANSNWAAVVGSGSLWSNTSSFVVGGSGSFNQLMVSNGGAVIGASVTIGESSGGNSNSAWVTDGGILQSSGALTLGAVAASVGNTLTISNGGKVYSGGSSILGASKGAPLGKVILTGSGSLWTNSTLLFPGQSNEMYVLDGAVMQGFNTFVGENTSSSMSSNNTVVVADRGAWTNLGSLYVGAFGNGNRFVVTNGGTAYVANNVSVGYINSNPSGTQVISNNQLLVSGSTSRMTVGSNIYVGHGSATSKSFYDMGAVIVSNGATLTAGAVAVGIDVRNSNNLFVVSGTGTLAQLSVGLMVGSNAGTINNSSSVNGLGSALVRDGATLEANWLQVGYANTGAISNLGGVYQFATNTPKIVANTVGAIVLNNGTIAFRGITNADVMGSLGSNQLSNIVFSGTNTFRLNSASNTFAASPQNYTFGYTASTPSNYTGLEMINGATAWKSAWLNIGSNSGTMLISNTSATIAGVTTNSGTVTVVNSRVTWQSNVVISGSYISDPSTNTFVANVTVAPDGYLVGGRVVSNADLFVFEKDLLMLSTNRLFDVSQAGFLFTNSANHLLSISNSGALNIGQGYASFAQVASNFAIGTLSIASGNRMTLSGLTNGPVTNALYVGWLDIQGWSTNSGYTSVTNSLLLALNLPDVNFYYNKYDERNQWLNDFIPDTGYDLWGGGLLLPIPEPSPFLAVGAGLTLLAFLRRRRAP
jgi:autotransporter-associated beta strand protein